jgi:hypothetical protein
MKLGANVSSFRSAPCLVGLRRSLASSYYLFVVLVVVVIRHETTAAARWALLLVAGAFFNDTIAVAFRAGLHVYLPRVDGHAPGAGSLAAGPSASEASCSQRRPKMSQAVRSPAGGVFRRSRRKFERIDDTLRLLTCPLTTGPVRRLSVSAAAGQHSRDQLFKRQ